MEIFIRKKDKYANSESEFVNGKWKTRYFHLYCDICEVRHPDKCVNDVYPEEGYEKAMDLCHDCQKKLYNKRLEQPDKIKWF